MPLQVRDLLNAPGLGLRLLTDASGADHEIRHVFTTDLPDPSRYLTPDDLVLTGMTWCREAGDADRFVRAMAQAGAGVMGAGEALGAIKPEVIQACGQYGIALLAVPAETSFALVSDEVSRRLTGDRVTAMTRVLGRRRLLLSAVAEGAGLDAMFRLMGREMGVDCWLLTAMGRVVGGTGPSLAAPLGVRLAAEYLRADRLPTAVRIPSSASGGGKFTLFGVGGEPRVTSWFVACAGHEQDWGPAVHELRESVAELAADAALERARLDAGRAGDRKLAEAIVTMLAAQAEGTARSEVASLMRTAGLAPDAAYLVAAMTADAARMAGQNAERWRCDLAEELAVPYAGGAVAAPLGDQVVILLPLPADHEAAAPHAFTERLRAAAPVLECDRSRVRLAVGVSAPAAGVAGLAGALHEAGSARRLAVLRAASAVSAVASDEVASHELLLAGVPGSVLRSFRQRLLGPLEDYDERHRAELLPTLREFLACSGSWNSCAATMYVHVNTVRYRIRRIEELTGRDLSSLDDQVDFFLALRIN